MSDAIVQIERLAHAAGLPLPAYTTPNSAGADLCAAVQEEIVLRPGERALIPSGFKMAISPGYEAQIRPRSGLALRHGVTVLNSPGTIDADYRGEVGVVLINLGDQDFTVRRGDRIAQIVIGRVESAVWRETGALSQTSRGSAGFGSTGLGSSGRGDATPRHALDPVTELS
jgi:dUTP pyrophosphatase